MTEKINLDRYLKASLVFAVMVGLALWIWSGNQRRIDAAPLAGIEEINHQCPDGAELNDTYDSAFGLTTGLSQAFTLDSGGSIGTHDKDWFSFSVEGGQQVNLTATYPATTSLLSGVEMALYTAEADAAADVSEVSSANGQLTWTAPAAVNTQTVWVKVINPDSAAQFSFCDAVYQLTLAMPGNLDNSKTTKAVTGDEDRVVTYEITLHNTGEALSGVNVTDQLPAGMTLTNVSVAPTSATTSLQSNQTSFTWIGAVAQSSEVVLTVTAQVDAEATTVAENTVQINDGQIFTRSSTALQFETPFKYIFLPLLMRGS